MQLFELLQSFFLVHLCKWPWPHFESTSLIYWAEKYYIYSILIQSCESWRGLYMIIYMIWLKQGRTQHIWWQNFLYKTGLYIPKQTGLKLFSFLCYTILSTHLTLASNVLRKKGQDVDITSRTCSDQSPAQLQQGSRGCYIIFNLSGSRPFQSGRSHIFLFSIVLKWGKDSHLSCVLWKRKSAFSQIERKLNEIGSGWWKCIVFSQKGGLGWKKFSKFAC